jgi:putative endopeptidase
MPSSRMPAPKYLRAHREDAGDGGRARCGEDAAAILEARDGMAKMQWTRVENRDPDQDLQQDRDRRSAAADAGLRLAALCARRRSCGKVDYVIIGSRAISAASQADRRRHALPVWKAISSGISWRPPRPTCRRRSSTSALRSRHGVCAASREPAALEARHAAARRRHGRGLGKLYVDKYFPPQNKARMEALVATCSRPTAATSTRSTG